MTYDIKALFEGKINSDVTRLIISKLEIDRIKVINCVNKYTNKLLNDHFWLLYYENKFPNKSELFLYLLAQKSKLAIVIYKKWQKRIKVNVHKVLSLAAKANDVAVMKLFLIDPNLDPNMPSNLRKYNHYINSDEYYLFRNEIPASVDLDKYGNFSCEDTINCYPLFIACYEGYTEIVKILLAHPNIDPNINHDAGNALLFASKRGYFEIVKLLLDHPKIDPNIKRDFRIGFEDKYVYDCKKMHLDPDIELCLWKHKERCIWEDGNVIINAAVYNKIEMLKFLLQDSRVDPALDDNKAIRLAAQLGHTEIVKVLLKDSRVEPAAKNNYAICKATKYGHTKVVNLLLKDPRIDARHSRKRSVDPTIGKSYDRWITSNRIIYHSYPLLKAVKRNYLEIVKLLLNDYRVKATLRDNYVFRKAVAFNRIEIVKEFLKCTEINPNMYNGSAMKIACHHGDLKMVKLLLKDKRVAKYYYENPEELELAIAVADNSNHTQIVKLLIAIKFFIQKHK